MCRQYSLQVSGLRSAQWACFDGIRWFQVINLLNQVSLCTVNLEVDLLHEWQQTGGACWIYHILNMPFVFFGGSKFTSMFS